MKAEIRVEEKYIDDVNGVIANAQNSIDDADGTTVYFGESEVFNFVQELMHSVEVKPTHNGTLLDKSLVQEMGKAYRERFEVAKKADDQVNMNRAYGAMQVLKKVMEMVG